MTTWYWRTFHKLTPDELYEILALRQAVFVLEQKCLYPDIDYQDQKAIHLLGIKNNKLIAYLRLFPKGELYPEAVSFGRFLTDPSSRGKGYAKAVMKQVESYLKQNANNAPVIISAQLYLKAFYEDYGFQVVEDPYDEDGILHVKMVNRKFAG